MILMEVLTSIFLMGMVGLFSLILISSMFGCFGFILFWLAILSFFIVFDISFKFLFFAILAFYAFGIVMKIVRYYQMPDYDTYLNTNSNAYQHGQAVCAKCGSTSIANLGLFGYYGKLRYFACTRCRSWLYRFRVL